MIMQSVGGCGDLAPLNRCSKDPGARALRHNRSRSDLGGSTGLLVEILWEIPFLHAVLWDTASVL